ncbi:hypothetical protein DA798_00340 [Lactobacillus sp. PFC-70]|nr:hypothetical protein DA798_00340 [Lactobacillus sp. PFC-70]
MSFGLVSVFQLAYPKAELEDLGLSGLQVVPTTFQPLQGQPVRRGIATICPLIKRRKKRCKTIVLQRYNSLTC